MSAKPSAVGNCSKLRPCRRSRAATSTRSPSPAIVTQSCRTSCCCQPDHSKICSITGCPGTARNAPITSGAVSAAASPAVCSRYSRASTDERHVEPERQRQPARRLRRRRREQRSPERRPERRRPHQWPVFAMLFHGSRGSSDPPICNSSTDTLSGERTKAMCPSRGGRLITTPAAFSFSHMA